MAELNKLEDKITLRYLTETAEFKEAQQQIFTGYPAFADTHQIHENVLDAFMRRLPPRSRKDFNQYLANLRIRPNTELDDFMLLGYSGAKLPTDGFSIIHPFDTTENMPCELLLEASGYSYFSKNRDLNFKIGDPATFEETYYNNEHAIKILINGDLIGWVNRGLIATFLKWKTHNQIIEATVEKLNGSPSKPAVYLFVRISA